MEIDIDHEMAVLDRKVAQAEATRMRDLVQLAAARFGRTGTA